MKTRALILVGLFILLLAMHPAALIAHAASTIDSPHQAVEYGVIIACTISYSALIYLFLHLFSHLHYQLTLMVRQKYAHEFNDTPAPTPPRRITLAGLSGLLLLFISVFGYMRTQHELLEQAVTHNWKSTVNICIASGCSIAPNTIYSVTTATFIPVEQRAPILRKLLHHTDIEQHKATLQAICKSCKRTPASRDLLPVFAEFGLGS